MPDPDGDEILDPRLEPAERAELLEAVQLLEQARPRPRAAFKDNLAGRLRRKLSERKRLLETARLLEQARPVPRPAFRGKLAKQLRAPSLGLQRPRLLIGAYAGSGLALLAVVAIGLAGVGPLAPG